MTPARLFRRRLALLLLVVCLGLLRAERGVAELRGRTNEPGLLMLLVQSRGATTAAHYLHELAGRVRLAIENALP